MEETLRQNREYVKNYDEKEHDPRHLFHRRNESLRKSR